MFGVESGGVLGNFQGKRAGRIRVRGAGDGASVELAPACGEAGFFGFGEAGVAVEIGLAQFGMN
jgi:hypothetical protein